MRCGLGALWLAPDRNLRRRAIPTRQEVLLGTAAILVSVALGPSAAAKGAIPPQTIVERIYARAIRPLPGEHTPGGGSFLFEKPSLAVRFTTGFIDLWTRAYAVADEDVEGPLIDFDVVTNSQDPDFDRYRAEVESQAVGRQVVAAKMWTRTGRTPEVVRYDFILERGAWRIDNIRGSVENDPWSLRDILNGAFDKTPLK